ncbi:MAG: hypothetical protein ACK4ZM_04245 [bacterium]
MEKTGNKIGYIFSNLGLIEENLKELSSMGLITFEISSSLMLKEIYDEEFYRQVFLKISDILLSLRGKIYRKEDILFF